MNETRPTQPREPTTLPRGPARRILPFETRPNSPQAPPRQPLLLPEASDPLVIDETDSDIQLVKALRSRQSRQRDRAKDLLQKRGFSRSEFDLANRLHDSDPLVRLRLVADLPSARGVSPLPWLFLLAADPDRRVRAAAIATLSTNPRRSVYEKLIELEQTERDTKILAQLRDAIKRRRAP